MFSLVKEHLRLNLARAGVVPLGYRRFLDMKRSIVTATMAMNLAEYARHNNPSKLEARFVDFAIANRAISYSQWAQDLFVVFCLPERKDGTFVEFGGADGLTYSNSALLESEYGWRGILIEPNPFEYPLLRKNRPNAIVLEGAVKCTNDDFVELIVCGQLSSVRGFGDRDFHSHARQASTVRRTVRCFELNDLIRAADFKKKMIDYMSIDTEGSEIPILRRFDFELGPLVLTVETNSRHDDETNVRALLQKMGYREPFSSKITRTDLWFVREDIYENLMAST